MFDEKRWNPANIKKHSASDESDAYKNSLSYKDMSVCKGERFNAQQSGQTVFYCTVKYLQYLRYLPVLSDGPDKYKFSWEFFSATARSW